MGQEKKKKKKEADLAVLKYVWIHYYKDKRTTLM